MEFTNPILKGTMTDEEFKAAIRAEFGDPDISIPAGSGVNAAAAQQAQDTAAAAREQGPAKKPQPTQQPAQEPSAQDRADEPQPSDPAEPDTSAGEPQPSEPAGDPAKPDTSADGPLSFAHTFLATKFGMKGIESASPEGARAFLLNVAQKTGYQPNPKMNAQQNVDAAAQHLDGIHKQVQNFVSDAGEFAGFKPPRSSKDLADDLKHAGMKVLQKAIEAGYPADPASITDENIGEATQGAMEFLKSQTSPEEPGSRLLTTENIRAVISLFLAAYTIGSIKRTMQSIAKIALDSPRSPRM